jgi:hypothetical protein
MITEREGNHIHNYRIEPGDATCYRFGFQRFSGDPDKDYTLDSGVGKEADQDYIWAYIKMPSATGIATIPVWDLRNLNLRELAGYLRTHGFEHINGYTLYAVLLAFTVLVDTPNSLKQAAEQMLKVPEYL